MPLGRTGSRAIVLVACLALLPAAEASAWSGDGHRIICHIASLLLDAPRQAEVARLARLYRTPDGRSLGTFPSGCVFPDDARVRARDGAAGWERFGRFDPWHFVNLPRTARRVAGDHCDGDCVLSAIAHHSEGLRGASTDAARAEALFFVGHWVGDIHQPLHVSFADDLGGNRTTVSGGFYTSANLHAVWDSGILGRAIGRDGWSRYAETLIRRITPDARDAWSASDALAWAQESYDVTTGARTRYCTWQDAGGQTMCARSAAPPVLTESYQREFEPVVALRLQQAGVRLAALIQRHLVIP
jgi:hypothetical protein